MLLLFYLQRCWFRRRMRHLPLPPIRNCSNDSHNHKSNHRAHYPSSRGLKLTSTTTMLLPCLAPPSPPPKPTTKNLHPTATTSATAIPIPFCGSNPTISFPTVPDGSATNVAWLPEICKPKPMFRRGKTMFFAKVVFLPQKVRRVVHPVQESRAVRHYENTRQCQNTLQGSRYTN